MKRKFVLERIWKNIVSLMALGTLFFALAGTVNVLGFWIYVAVVLLYQIVSLLIIVPRYPAYMTLANERKAKHANVKKWDKRVVLVLTMATFLMYGLAALDLGRFHVGELSLGFALPGIALYVAGSALNQWAMLCNPHFERGVRIQEERGHRVADTGPYRYVRHPGYLGSVLFYVAFPLMVGSAAALFGSIVGIVGMIVRTGLEDRTLKEELAGYTEYARVTRCRLIPYVW